MYIVWLLANGTKVKITKLSCHPSKWVQS